MNLGMSTGHWSTTRFVEMMPLDWPFTLFCNVKFGSFKSFYMENCLIKGNSEREKKITKLLSHLSAHMVNHLLRENLKTIPKFLSGKNFSKM